MITIHQRHRQTDRQTDRQTTCDRNTALCTKVHRAVKIVSDSNNGLHTLLPPLSTASQHYNLRRRTHTYSLPGHELCDCNFITPTKRVINSQFLSLLIIIYSVLLIHRESKKETLYSCPLSLLNIDRFSQFFHRRTQLELCNKIINKDPTSPQMCCYTTL